MYFVGKNQLRIHRNNKTQLLHSGEPIPEAASWAGLRHCLERKEVICDYKNGEIRAEHLPFLVAQQPTKSEMIERLKSADIHVPIDAKYQEICTAYNASHLKMDLANGVPAWMNPADEVIPFELELPKKERKLKAKSKRN